MNMVGSLVIVRELIYWPVNHLKPQGGPSGYLCCLKRGLDEIKAEIDYLPKIGNNDNKGRGASVFRNCVWMADLHRMLKLGNLAHCESSPQVNINSYGLIHFHSTQDLFEARKWLKTYDGLVVLTSHTPCAPHVEKLNWFWGEKAKRAARKRLYEPLRKIDEFAFSRADAVIFPCKEAEEPYRHTWDGYERAVEKTPRYYVPTGTIPCVAKVSREAVRARLGVPQEAKVVSYVGRHNDVKGYGDLKEFADNYLTQNTNAWFIIGGAEGPIYGLNRDRWIEVGWTDDPHSLISASDVFVLPNRETYFDLIFLEALSLGVPIVASRTGGNKFFERFGSRGIRLYSTASELRECLDELLVRYNDYDIEVCRSDNKELFANEFDDLVFARRYQRVLKRIERECTPRLDVQRM